MSDTTYEQPLSPGAYLVRERHAEYRSEYWAGDVEAMTGASRPHNLVVTSLVRSLGNALHGGPCEVYSQSMRVRLQSARAYVYPDVVVACGSPRFEDAEVDTLIDPVLVIEVLSPTTERYDRGRKADAYRAVETLREYLLVAQDAPRVERYRRGEDGAWSCHVAASLEDEVELESVGCVLRLAEVYERVLPLRGPGT
jgi:Uma2 family endonuclease